MKIIFRTLKEDLELEHDNAFEAAQNILADKDIHILIWKKKQKTLPVIGIPFEIMQNIVKFMVRYENEKIEIVMKDK